MKAVASPNSAPGHGAPFLVRLPPDQKEGVHRGVCVCVCVGVCVEPLRGEGVGCDGGKGETKARESGWPGASGSWWRSWVGWPPCPALGPSLEVGGGGWLGAACPHGLAG